MFSLQKTEKKKQNPTQKPVTMWSDGSVHCQCGGKYTARTCKGADQHIARCVRGTYVTLHVNCTSTRLGKTNSKWQVIKANKLRQGGGFCLVGVCAWPCEVPPTFGHGPGTDVGCHAASFLGGILVASLQLNAIASEVAQARDDQWLFVYHLLKGPVLLRVRGRAGRGGIGETGSRWHGCRHIALVTKGPAFPRWPVTTTGHTSTTCKYMLLENARLKAKTVKPGMWGSGRIKM